MWYYPTSRFLWFASGGLLSGSVYSRCKAQWLLQISLLIFCCLILITAIISPHRIYLLGFVVYEIWGSSDSAMKITVFRDFSFGARNIPMHDRKACEEMHISSILNTGSGYRRCVTLSDLTDMRPEISEYFYQTIRLCVPIAVFRDAVLFFLWIRIWISECICMILRL